MAIAQDASTPAVVSVTGNTSATSTTASFTPPANSLLVALACYAYNSSTSGSPLTFSDSLSGTWTPVTGSPQLGSGGGPAGGISTRFVTSSAAMTVTLTTDTLQKGKLFQVLVLTGTATSSYVGASNGIAGSSTGTLDGSLTTTVTGSWLLCSTGYDNNNTFTADANSTLLSSLQDATEATAYYLVQSTNPTVTPGSKSIGVTGTTDTTTLRVWVAAEILPPAGVIEQLWNIPPINKQQARISAARCW